MPSHRVPRHAPHVATNWEQPSPLPMPDVEKGLYTLVKGSDAGSDITTTDLWNDELKDIAFAGLAEEVAKSNGRNGGTEEDWDLDQLQIMTSDAWDECLCDLRPAFSTYVYEMLPYLISQFLCFAFEGRTSAENRQMWYIGTPAVVHDILNKLHYVCLALCLLAGAEYAPIDLLIQLVLISFRSASISAKYCYMPESDRNLIQSSTKWREGEQTLRALGGNSLFNMAGTYHFDVMKELLTAALRARVLSELSDRKFKIPVQNAQTIWAEVKEFLVDIDENPGMLMKSSDITRASKFGDIQHLLGLADVGTIETEVAAGELRVSVAAYYFAVKEYGPTCFFMPLIVLLGLLLGFMRPLMMRWAGDDVDQNMATSVFYWVRGWSMGCSFFVLILYCVYPFMDAKRRYGLNCRVLSSIGHQETRAIRLASRTGDMALDLTTADDLVAFWVMQRVLGPEIYRGQMIRYNSAYACVTVVHLLVLCGLLGYFGDHSLAVPAASAIEVLIMFAVGIPFIVGSTLYADWANRMMKKTQKVMERVAVDAVLKGADDADTIQTFLEVLGANLEDVSPISIFYLPATSEVLFTVWAALSVISNYMVAHLKQTLPWLISIPGPF